MQALTTNETKKLLTRKEAAELLGTTAGTLCVWAHLRKGPKFRKLGRAVRYHIDELQAYIAGLPAVATSDQA